MPNLVHSLDAASLGLLTEMFFSTPYLEAKNFYAIHDCFAIPANKVETLSYYIKAVYFQLYSNETYLLKFDQKIRESIISTYGDKIFDFENNKIRINDLKVELEWPQIIDVIGSDTLKKKDCFCSAREYVKKFLSY